MHESDLIPKYQPVPGLVPSSDFVRPHVPIGVQQRLTLHLLAMQTLTKILTFHVEVVFEAACAQHCGCAITDSSGAVRGVANFQLRLWLCY
eukprot:2149137-Amphidinium_carterae.1